MQIPHWGCAPVETGALGSRMPWPWLLRQEVIGTQPKKGELFIQNSGKHVQNVATTNNLPSFLFPLPRLLDRRTASCPRCFITLWATLLPWPCARYRPPCVVSMRPGGLRMETRGPSRTVWAPGRRRRRFESPEYGVTWCGLS